MAWVMALVAILPVADFRWFWYCWFSADGDIELMVIGDSDGDGDHVIGGNKLGDWFWCQDVWSPRSPVDLVTYPPVTYLVTYALFPNSLKEQAQTHTGWGTRCLIISRGPCWHPTNCPHTQSANISQHIKEFTISGACLLGLFEVSFGKRDYLDRLLSFLGWLKSDA